MTKFTSQIDNWARKSRTRMTAVVREAAQELTEEVLTPRGKGGNMPVDTGFLRNSVQGDVNAVPRGTGFYDPSDAAGDRVTSDVIVAISKLEPGDKFYLGFTANYARYMEARYAFIRLAAQNWDHIVVESVKRVRQQYNSVV